MSSNPTPKPPPEAQGDHQPTFSIDGGANTATSSGTKMLLQPQHRKMKTYTINSTEMLTMPLLSFVSAALLALGLWFVEQHIGASQIADEATKEKVRAAFYWSAWGCFITCGLLQVGYWLHYTIIRKESRQTS